MKDICISVDVLGGDYAPDVVAEGIALALQRDDTLRILAVGPEETVRELASANERVEALVSTQFIDMGEHPATAVRTKKDSSIVLACKAVKEGRAQGFFSAGSTGACLAAATLIMGRLPGVKRPALASVLPAPSHPVVLTDVGANADCKAEYLLQFAQMAKVYSKLMLAVDKPRIALVNIGAEEAKGSLFAQECHQLMKERLPEFAGNAEGHDILEASHDIYVTDGFTGNVILKTLEGSIKVLFSSLKEVMSSSTKNKLAAAALKPALKDFKKSIDPDSFGGAPLLGVKGVCFIGHGSSKAEAICSGILATARAARMDMPALIEQELALLPCESL